MPVVSWVICGLVLCAMIGIAVYGWVTLPPVTRLPFVPGALRRDSPASTMSKAVAVVTFPLPGLITFALLVLSAENVFPPGPSHGHQQGMSMLPVTGPASLAMVAGIQWFAIWRGRKAASAGRQEIPG